MSETAGSAGNALISVYDKSGIEDFAGGLHEMDWSIYASGGTRDRIKEAGIPVTDIADLVGGGAILGHKVVTLSREISAGILADMKDEKEMEEMRELGYPLIHLVCQDSYPLEAEIANEESTPKSVVGQTDIGGPNLLRMASKGDRIVLCVPQQRQQVLEWLHAGRPNEAEFLAELAARARYEVARYTMLEAKYWNGAKMSGHIALLHTPAKYGENAPQVPAGYYADNRVNVNPLGLDQFQHAKGWELSLVNMADMDRLLQTSTHIAAGFERNFGEVPKMAVGVKHGNACGAAVADTFEEAVANMLDGDQRAIFGGFVMINGEIDASIAKVLMTHGKEEGDIHKFDGIMCASITEEALEIIDRKKTRIEINPALANLNESSLDTTRRLRSARGGVLVQPNYTFVQDLAAEHMKFYGPELNEQQKRDLVLAWAVGCTSNSNTITVVKDGMLIGNGVGQQDRVGAAELALSRTSTQVTVLEYVDGKLVISKEIDPFKLEGAVAYSDSFYSHTDAVKLLIEAGIKALLTSSGSQIGDESFKALVAETSVSAAMVPDKVGRGFYAH